MNNLTTTGLPAHLQGKDKIYGIGDDIDHSQLPMPRIKLLQAVSPEVTQFPGKAKAGEFWHTALGESLGPTFDCVPIAQPKQYYLLWAPLGDQRGILARVHNLKTGAWDRPNEKFEVQFDDGSRALWNTRDNLEQSGLARFGSSKPDNPNSPPAAVSTYEFLWYLPEYSEIGMTIHSKSDVRPCTKFISFLRSQSRLTSIFYQRCKLTADRRTSGIKAWFGVKFEGDGYTDEELGKTTEELFMMWKDRNVESVNERSDDDVVEKRSGQRPFAPLPGERPVDDDIPF